MEFNCKVNIVDAIMGAGKTQSIMNYINQSNDKFLVITPFLDEITRYRTYCKSKNFKSPKFENKKTKLDNIKYLVEKGENIVSTHALFQKFDNEKRLCDLGSLVCYGNDLMVWLFPIETFNSFRNIFILTYKFELQLQKYYYDYYGLQYQFWSVEGNDLENYHLVTYEPNKSYLDYNYEQLIHICEIEKLNLIGDRDTDLSKSWYVRNKNNTSIKVLKNNIQNFFRNIRNDNSSDNIWTTFKDYQSLLKGKGYTKGYLPLNSRATNEYRERTSVAYPVNRYLNPFVKNFFNSNNIEVDENGFALSEMLQFIWRSAIRDGKEIWVYIPSIRMRNLLKQWIKQNSPQITTKTENKHM